MQFELIRSETFHPIAIKYHLIQLIAIKYHLSFTWLKIPSILGNELNYETLHFQFPSRFLDSMPVLI
jgi:hypothetical protein